MKNIILLGNIATGKGSITQLFSKRKKINIISMGDILRKESNYKTKIGTEISEFINKGNLVPDSISNNLFLKYIQKDDCIVDGYPRNMQQLENVLNTNYEFRFILLNCLESVSINRALTRLICEKCQKVYNTLNLNDLICSCGSDLQQRTDDMDEEIICKRYTLQKEHLNEMLIYLFDKDISVSIFETDCKLRSLYANIRNSINDI